MWVPSVGTTTSSWCHFICLGLGLSGVTQRPPPEALTPSGPALASVTVCWLQQMHIGVGVGASRIGGVLLTFGLM